MAVYCDLTTHTFNLNNDENQAITISMDDDLREMLDMNESIEKKLKQSYQALDEANRNQDWKLLANLEPEARKSIQQAVEQRSSLTIEEQGLLDELGQLYQEMIKNCQQERDRIKEQIKVNRQRQEAVSSYLEKQRTVKD